HGRSCSRPYWPPSGTKSTYPAVQFSRATSLGHTRSDLVGDGAPLSAGGLRRLLGEGRGNEGAGNPAAALAGMGQNIAHEVNPAALPSGAQDLGDSRLDAFMGIGDHQLDTAQAAAGQLA